QRRLIDAQLAVEGRHHPIARVEHLAGRLGVVALIDVPQAGTAEVGQAQAGPERQQQQVVPAAGREPSGHSVVPPWQMAGAGYGAGRLGFRVPLAAAARWTRRDRASLTSTVNPRNSWEDATVPLGNSPWTAYRLPARRSTVMRSSRGSTIQYSRIPALAYS